MAITIDGTNGLTTDNAALKLDGTTLVVDDTNNRVGVGTASPAVAMDVVGQVRASTGILFGSDTAAANALDDYEEGTWTPTLNFDGASVGVTYASNRNGYYTKIGRLVTVFCYIELTNKGSSTGTPGISGLPFTSANLTSGYTTSGSVWMYAASSLSGSLTMLLPNNSSNLSLRAITGTGDNFTISNSNFGNTTQIIVSASYYTT